MYTTIITLLQVIYNLPFDKGHGEFQGTVNLVRCFSLGMICKVETLSDRRGCNSRNEYSVCVITGGQYSSSAIVVGRRLVIVHVQNVRL